MYTKGMIANIHKLRKDLAVAKGELRGDPGKTEKLVNKLKRSLVEEKKKFNPRNKVVRVTDESTGEVVEPPYDRLPSLLGGLTQQNQVGVFQQIRGLMGGIIPAGDHAGFAKELYVWLVQQEGHRNTGAMVTNALMVDLGARGRVTPVAALALNPMKPKGSQGAATELNEVLRGQRVGLTSEAEKLARAEMDIVRAWVTAHGRLATAANSGTEQEFRRKLYLKLFARVCAIYGVTQKQKAELRGMVTWP